MAHDPRTATGGGPHVVPDDRHDELHDEVAARLRATDNLYTSGRRRLVELLADASQPLSIPELLDLDRGAAQSSVYRSLAVLDLVGVVHRIVTADEFARFELAEELSGHHHHHLICSSCGSVEDIELSSSLEVSVTRELQRVAEKRGFVATSHQMDLVGICSDCR